MKLFIVSIKETIQQWQVGIVIIYLQADTENKILSSRRIFTKAIDAITLMYRAHQQMTS